MALTADSKELYIPLETIYGKPDGQGNYLMQALDIKRINDNLWNIVKKIQGNLTLADLTDLAVQTLTAVTVITQNLYATYGDVAELTVDRLETANKVDMYWDSDTSDINYISIQGQYIKFITGTTTGSTTQHTDRNGNNLYYNSEPTVSTYKTVGMTTTTTAYPVTVYSYTSATKMELSFALVGSDYEVDWILGAGTGTGDYGKVKFHKDTTGINQTYYNGSTGAERTIRLDDDFIKVIGNTGGGFNVRNVAIDTTSNIAGYTSQMGDLEIPTDDYTRYDKTALTGNTTLSEDANEFITASGTFTLTLHAATSAGIIKKIYNVGTGVITVAGTINGATNMYLYPGESVELITDGSGWRY